MSRPAVSTFEKVNSVPPHPTVVRADVLRHFSELVRDKGGDPRSLYASLGIDPRIVQNRDSVISYQRVTLLFEQAADLLSCPDFGMQLAHRQYRDGILGALDIAMRNCETVGDAWRYCAEHAHAYSAGTRVKLTRCADSKRWAVVLEILLPGLHRHRQAFEHSLLMSQLATRMLSGGKALAEEVWFVHEPVAGSRSHARQFRAKVRFQQPFCALFFNDESFIQPVINHDDRIRELAEFFISHNFPCPTVSLVSRVRATVARQLADGFGSNIEVAEALGMHPRKMQRHLCAEGTSFEIIKDSARRDIAFQLLTETALSVNNVANKLGYSDAASFYRSCHRWFNGSPTEIRALLKKTSRRSTPNLLSESKLYSLP